MKRLIQACGLLFCAAAMLLFGNGQRNYVSAESDTVVEEPAAQDIAETQKSRLSVEEPLLLAAAAYNNKPGAEAATDTDADAPENESADAPEEMADVTAETGIVKDSLESEDWEESEYADLAISNVEGYVNVRDLPTTEGKKLGKLYSGAVAHILEKAGENDEWFKITSGSVEGYIRAEYFIYGKDAVEVIDDYVTRYAVSQVDHLNVRAQPQTDAKKLGYLDKKEKVIILENLGDWLKVQYSENKTGYVFAQYTATEEMFDYAISLEEERANLERQKILEQREREEREQAQREQAQNEQQNEAASAPGEETPAPTQEEQQPQESVSYGANEDLRSQILAFAKQYLGNKYVSGGNSLETGTDCSGFTSLVYKEFGYSLHRTPSGQLSSSGKSVSLDEIQIGDIVCYGKKKCTHVALYAGDGQIIHAATPKDGIKMGNLYFDSILGVKNVID